MIDKKIKKFIYKNLQLLENKNLAFFICCGFDQNKKTYFETNIPKNLMNKFLICESFGGEININKQTGINKLLVKMISKNNDINIKILDDNINSFIQKINEFDKKSL